MKKIMFDSNVFDKLPEFIKLINNDLNKYEYFVTTTQIEELCDIPDSKIDIRKRNILMLVDLRVKLIPMNVFVYGKSRWGYARYGGGEVYHKILNENKSNRDDAIIADTAVSEGCTLITSDTKFYHKMLINGYDVMSFSEFLETFNE